MTDSDIARILEFDGNDSTVEGLSDEDFEGSQDLEPRLEELENEGSNDDSSDDDVPLAAVAARQTSSRRLYFKHENDFTPYPPGMYCQPLAASRVNLLQEPIEYFLRYIPEVMFEIISNYSNQTYLLKKGQNLNTTKEEIKLFFGISIAMSYLGLPRIRMYWANRTRVAMIADRMTRDRYFKIRTNLKLVNDLEVDEASKQNKFWKVNPLIKTVRKACLETPRSQHTSVDEQMIPFWGQVSMRQFIRGKPNPCGLKNFVCTTPDGVPLDFFMYEGKGDTILTTNEAEGLDIGGKVVLKLSETLPEGVKLYMDRYFTSLDLLDKLRSKKMQATGTLRKANIPKNCNFKTDNELRKQGRGSSDQLVRSDGNVACLKWFDNKPVIMASSVDSKEPINKCRRWCKKTKQYIQIDRPFAIEQYNTMMGGVDMLDRVISFYRIRARSKKWTVRLIFHFFDFAAAAGWLVYRNEAKLLECPKKNILDYLEFKVQIANSLLYFTPAREQIHIIHEVDSDDSTEEAQPWSRKRKCIPQPPVQLMTAMAGHLPLIDEQNDNHRCRMPGCKSKKARVFCSTCNMHLCLVIGRNCYKRYHESV
ncbi:unnamed protein product [Parnassius mnemosyne]|uniref:PiggyBac transposable element-derived protein domain-containing protein n=1 Tax=Parnassius mnemosyne TaxID=213953 RepID=A0AAV1L043_9NEOP